MAQNSGIHYDSLDENGEYTTYYGFVHEIWELEYVSIFRFLSFDANGLKANEVSVWTTMD